VHHFSLTIPALLPMACKFAGAQSVVPVSFETSVGILLP
jgi:hypothetical protein